MRLIEKVKLRLKHDFTDAERLQMGNEIAESQAKVQEIEGEQKAIKKQLDAQIAESQARVNLLCNQMRSGYDMRPVDCSITFDWDAGKKAYIRMDTGEIARIEDITDKERQIKLDLDAENEGAEVAEEAAK